MRRNRSAPRLRNPRRSRLRKAAEIRMTQRTGKRTRSPVLDFYVSVSEGAGSRAVVIVPRLGHTAVARNRVRRRIGEILRTDWLPEARRGDRNQVSDLVVRAREGAYESSFDSLRQAVAEFKRGSRF